MMAIIKTQNAKKILKFRKKISIFNSKQYITYLLLFVFCLPYITTNAQELKKPKIGLVLSGGGAKGFAHIGVLKEIEKAGIKIDYIGGTSMGAIIGGLYASGYSANQIDSIFKNTNFDELVQDFVPRNNKTFYEKRNDEIYAFSLPFQKLKITVPKGISKGLYNYNLISKLTHHVRYVRDFNQLKIPFICIGTNVETGEETIFNSGSLPLALAASSAFPSLFSPIMIDGKYYVDGGVTNNYPVEEVRKMGADIIIGVDVQDGLKNINQIKGATGVLVQISNFQMIEKMKEKRKQTDIYINPNIEGFNVVSFDDGTVIIQKGEEAAQKVKNELLKLGDKNNTIQKNTKKADSIYIKEIGINDLKDYTRSYIMGKLRFRPGEKISFADLHSGINNLNATQNFSSISYTFNDEGKADNISLNLTENPIKTFLKLGLHYDDLYKSSALVNITKKNLLFTNDNASLDFILGDSFRFNLDYYRDNGYYISFGFKSRLNKFKRLVKNDFSGGDLLKQKNLKALDIRYVDVTNQIYLQTIFAQKFLLGAGVENKYLEISTNSLEEPLTYINRTSYNSLVAFLKYDSFNNKYFPKKGWYFYGDGQTFLTSTNNTNKSNKYTILKADLGIVQTFLKKITLKIQSEGGFTISENANNIFNFSIGGYGFSGINNIKPFYGYDFLDLTGDSYVKGTATIDWEFLKRNHINFSANYSNIGYKIFNNDFWISKPKYSGYAIGYGIETLIGPIEIKESWSPDTNKKYTFVSVGFWF